MRIGLPNLLPLFGFLFFGTVSITMTIVFLDKVDTAETGATIFIIIFLLLCYGMFGLLSFRFKIVVMTDNELMIISPFRLKLQNFTFDKIDDLRWDLWQTLRLGDYRKLNIKTNSGYRTNISDLEFINYDSLEKWILERTNLDLNLERKLNVELQQAKWNRWLNLIGIVMFVFFFILLSSEHRDNNINIAIRTAMILITFRLIVRLVQYQQRINENEQKRRLRKKNLPLT